MHFTTFDDAHLCLLLFDSQYMHWITTTGNLKTPPTPSGTVEGTAAAGMIFFVREADKQREGVTSLSLRSSSLRSRVSVRCRKQKRGLVRRIRCSVVCCCPFGRRWACCCYSCCCCCSCLWAQSSLGGWRPLRAAGAAASPPPTLTAPQRLQMRFYCFFRQ